MTRAANAGELTKLRSSGQWAKWHAIIDNPDVVYTARATGAINTTNYSLGFDGGSGTLANCLAHMTVLIGSTSGGYDIGIARLRKAPIVGTFYLGADPSIQVSDDDYITVINDWSIFPKHPIGVYIDVDVAYTDQLTNFVPVIVMGERVTVISAGDTISWDASQTWVPGSTISTWAWTFTGAASYNDEDTATPTATYNTSGRFRVSLRATAATGKYTIGYGWVYVLGPNLAPDTGIIISDVEAETETGWACKLLAYDRPTIHDRARVVIYSEDYFANEAGSIGPITDRENIIMIGWIVGETIVREPGQDYVEFTVGGPGVFCSRVSSMPVGLTDTAFPTDSATTLPAWSKMANLTIVKGFQHIIDHHSNMTQVIDVEVEDWTWPAHKLTADDETLWGQLVTFSNHGMLTCTPDRHAHLYIQRDAALYPIANRTANIPVIMSLGDGDWNDELSIVRRHHSEVAMTEAEGTVFSSGTVTPVGGRAPGDVSASFGNIENISEVNFPNLATALELAGLMGGRYAAEYESIGVSHPANNHFIDVAPRQYVNVTVDGATLRCIPRRVDMTRDDGGQVYLELDLEPEGGQWPAVSIDYPNEGNPPVNPGGGVPPPPPPPPTEPPEEPPETTGANAVVVTSTDVRITADLDAGSPTWTSIISGGPTTPVDSDLPETTNDTLYVIEATSIWKCTGVTGTPAWSEVWTGTDLTEGTIVALRRVRVAPGTDSLVYVLGYGTNTATGNLQPFVLRSSNGGSTWSEIWIADELAAGSITVLASVDAGGGNGIAVYTNSGNGIAASLIFPDIGFPQITYYAQTQFDPAIPDVEGVTVEFDATGDLPSTNYDTASDLWPYINYLVSDAWVTLTASPIDGGYHVSGTLDGTQVDDNNGDQGILHIGYFGAREARWENDTPTTRNAIYSNFVINGVSYGSGHHLCLDVSRTNNSYIYVGTPNSIWKSTDGGFVWTQSIEDHGSNDINVDPQLAGVYYHWAVDGSLELIVADVLSVPDLDTDETPVAVSLRLQRDLNSGRLWSLKSGTTLRLRNLGSSSDLDTGLSNARGLHAYLGGKLIYLDGSDIYYSDDYGATQALKKGGWSAYSGPINAHLMRETT